MPTDGAVNPKTSRRLAAILAADIAGYSALMGADEARTVRDLKEHQVIVLPMIREHGGRVIDTAGDGILAAAKARGVQFGRKPKLTLHQQAEGRRRLETGESARSIARDFNCHHAIVARLRLA